VRTNQDRFSESNFQMTPAPLQYFTKDHAVSMTLRDYFAAKALQGMSANPEDVHDADQETYDEYVEEISRCAYKMADAMMVARSAT
jgi:hypothetical protein